MTHEDLISVIIPAYNVQEYIERTIRSILGQTHTNFEIIIVDDGSKDNTPTIIDSLASQDSRIKVIHKENGGVTSARLRGAEEAQGDWIAFVDGDDCIEPEMYERLLSNALNYGADIAHCGYQMVFPSRVDYYYNSKRIMEQDTEKGLADLLEGKFIEPGLGNKLFRKSLIELVLKEQLMDYSIKTNEDLLLNYYLFKKSKKAIYEDVCLYHYILRSGSAATSSVNKNKLGDPVRVLDILIEDVKPSYELSRILEERYINLMIIHASFSIKHHKELVAPYRKTARRWLRNNWLSAIKKDYSKTIKIKASISALFPDIYRFIHFVYAKVNRIDKIYEIK